MRSRIYLDYAATTPIRPEVREAMEPYLGASAFGNPSSLHAEGQRVRHALDDARDIVALSLGVTAAEISFTSGGTEADNAALMGVMLGNKRRGNHLITTQIEHEAVLETAKFLESLGIRVTYLPVDHEGRVSPEQVSSALTPETVLVSIMHANNEVGTIQPISSISEVVHAHGALLHTDAVQTFGQLVFDAQTLDADLITISSHKIYGPKGIGALYVREGISIEPFIHGGGQERDRRAGTENVPGIVGFAKATQLLLAERDAMAEQMAQLRDTLIASLEANIPNIVLNGPKSDRLPNNVNISFPGLDAESLLLSLDLAGIAASSGSACTAGSIEPSHVLLAMGLSDARVTSAIRLTLGRATTQLEIDQTVAALVEITQRHWSQKG